MKTIVGFSRRGRQTQRGVSKPVLTISLHKSMTKSDLFEAAAITMHFLERNKMEAHSQGLQIRFNIEGFDDSPKELWEDPGSRTFCKMALAPFTVALAGHIVTDDGVFGARVASDGMDLVGMAAVALSGELGHPVSIGQNSVPGIPLLTRIVELIKEHADRVNTRTDELGAGEPANPHPELVVRCGEPMEMETCVYAAPGMGASMRQLIRRTMKLIATKRFFGPMNMNGGDA